MKTIAVNNLKNNIIKFLEIVKHGEELIITSHRKQIAKIIPPEDEIIKARKKLTFIQKTAEIGDVVSPVSNEWKTS